MIDVSNAFLNFQETISLESSTVGFWDDNGNWVPGAPVVLEIKAVVQPLSSDELLIVPEGERTKQLIKVHTKEDIKITNESTLTDADVFVYNGDRYTVINVLNRKRLGGYNKALAVKIDG